MYFTLLGLIPVSFLFVAGAYRLWFHPLAAYPGPFWARLTNLYAAYHAWKGDLHVDMWRCHQLYGDYIRYGPDRLIFNTAESLQDTYSFGKNVVKCKGYLTMMHRVPNTITQRNKALHAKQRRLLSNGFSDAALRSYEKPIHYHVHRLCQQLAKFEGEWSAPTNMSDWADYIAFDIMMDVIYGRQTNMLTEPDHRYLTSVIRESNIRVGVLMPLWFLKGTYIERFLFPGSIIARYKFLSFIKSLLKEKETEYVSDAARKSVYATLKGTKDSDGLSPNEIAAESTNLVIAGSDTTATVFAASIFYLSRNPLAYQTVSSEIRSTFSTPSSLQDRKRVNSCSYLRACLNETMRMASPISSSLFREAEAGGAMIDGHFIPEGADIGTCIYSIHHNEKYFLNPFLFCPERWITAADGSNEEDVAQAHSAFTPFSIGPRSCIGKALGLMELQSMLAWLLFHFDFRVAEGDLGRVGEGNEKGEWGRERKGEYQLFDHLTVRRHGPWVQLRKRELVGN